MKKIFIIIFVVSFNSFQLLAQIPNPGFENWTNGNPDGWFTDNIATVAVPITQTSDAHSGNSAVRGEVLNFANNPYPGYLYTLGDNGKGFPIDQRYAQLTGYYKLSTSGSDKFLVWVYFWSGGNIIAGNYGWFGAAANYTQFTVPLVYYTADVPDSASIWMAASEDTTESGTASIGTVFYVDDLSFSGTATSVTDKSNLNRFKLEQNYPNPFNPSTTISYNITKPENVQIKVYNILGVEVASLVNEYQIAGEHSIKFNAENLSSGIYFYKLNAGSFSQIKKMTLLK